MPPHALLESWSVIGKGADERLRLKRLGDERFGSAVSLPDLMSFRLGDVPEYGPHLGLIVNDEDTELSPSGWWPRGQPAGQGRPGPGA